MIRVTPAPEPAGFDARVRQPRLNALLEMIGSAEAASRPGPKREVIAERVEDIPVGELPAKWTEALDDLRDAYRSVCAYLGMRIEPATGAATVDHFVPKSEDRELAYEWSNLRLAAAQVNTNKGTHQDVLDPFAIEDGWFVLNVGTFEVEPADGLLDNRREEVQATIRRLKLNEPTFCEARQTYHDLYKGLSLDEKGEPIGPLPLGWLRRQCPFVASELARQGRLSPSDSER